MRGNARRAGGRARVRAWRGAAVDRLRRRRDHSPQCRPNRQRWQRCRARLAGETAFDRGSSPRLRLQFLEPVLNDDQLVGRAGLQRPNHKEAPVVRGHSVLWGKSERVESRSRKKRCSTAERKCRTGIYLDRHEVPRGVAIEQLAPAMGPERLRTAARRDLPLSRASVWKWDYIDLVLAGLVRDVRQPSPVG